MPRVNLHCIAQCSEFVKETIIHLFCVASGQVGSAAFTYKQGVASQQLFAVNQQANTVRRVSGGVDYLDRNFADFEDFAVVYWDVCVYF